VLLNNDGSSIKIKFVESSSYRDGEAGLGGVKSNIVKSPLSGQVLRNNVKAGDMV
jgi:biotin carboxyl carrier protein